MRYIPGNCEFCVYALHLHVRYRIKNHIVLNNLDLNFQEPSNIYFLYFLFKRDYLNSRFFVYFLLSISLLVSETELS